MNYYKQFAEMLGLELEQEFILTDADGNRKNKYTYKFTEDGVLYKSPTFTNWSINSLGTIGSLLNGDVKAVPKPWKPENGELYWYYSPLSRKTFYLTWEDGLDDLLLWKTGNCFRTEKEAATKGKEVMEAIHKEYEEA
jgi:hypothetical protein